MVPDVRVNSGEIDEDDTFANHHQSVSSRISQIVNSVTTRLSNATANYSSQGWNFPSWTSYSVFRWRRNRSHRSSSLFSHRSSSSSSSSRRHSRSLNSHGHRTRRSSSLFDPYSCSSSGLSSFLPPHSYAYRREVGLDSSSSPSSPSARNENSSGCNNDSNIPATSSSSNTSDCCQVQITQGENVDGVTVSDNTSITSPTNEMSPPSYPGEPSESIFFPRSLCNRSIFGYSILDRGLTGRSNRHRRLSYRLIRGHRDNNYYRRSSSHASSHFSDDREKNFLSALMSILVIATLATAFTQPKWFSVKGGVCGHKFIGLQLFIELNPSSTGSSSSHYLSNSRQTQTSPTATILNTNTNTNSIESPTGITPAMFHPHSKSSESSGVTLTSSGNNWPHKNGHRQQELTLSNEIASSESSKGEILPKPQSIFAFGNPIISDSYDQIINHTLHSFNLTNLISNEEPIESGETQANSQSESKPKSSLHASNKAVPKIFDEKAYRKEREQLLLLHALSPLETLNGFNHLNHLENGLHHPPGDTASPLPHPVGKRTHQTLNPHHAIHHVKKSCSFNEILPLQRTIVLLCLIAILANLAQFFLDTLGTNKKWLNVIRVHAVGSIFGVICSIFIIGICYIIATLIETNEKTSLAFIVSHTTNDGNLNGDSVNGDSTTSHIEVRFELSYYMITLAGLIGLFASACNLLKYSSFYLLPSSSGSFLITPDSFDPCSTQFNSYDDEPLTPLWASGATGISFALPNSILNTNVASTSSPSANPASSSANDSNGTNSSDQISSIPSTNILMPPSYPHSSLVPPPPPYTP